MKVTGCPPSYKQKEFPRNKNFITENLVLTLSSLIRPSGSQDMDMSLLYLNKLTCKYQHQENDIKYNKEANILLNSS